MERTPSPVVLGPVADPWLDLDLMGNLKLFGMRSAYDAVMAAGIKRQHEPPRIVGDLLQSEIAEIWPLAIGPRTAGEGPDPSATR